MSAVAGEGVTAEAAAAHHSAAEAHSASHHAGRDLRDLRAVDDDCSAIELSSVVVVEG